KACYAADADTGRNKCIAERVEVLAINYQDRIAIEPGKRGGKPCIRGMRITVYDVLEYLASGMSEPGPFSFRKEVAKQAQNELKGFVPRGASLSRHAPMTQNPFMETDAHDTTAPSAHRGLL